MIISRTPFRISFFGGGTDYRDWFLENGGTVLVSTIDKYCYISCRLLPPFFEHKTRVAYSKVERAQSNRDIKHPAVRAALEYLRMEEGVEIHHDGDLPARTGLGSSSAFTVGLLHGLHALQRKMPTKRQLACEAVHLERDILKEKGGVQDQYAVALGGFNRICFTRQEECSVQPMILPRERLADFHSHLMLYFTGFSRSSSKIAREHVRNIPRLREELLRMAGMVEEAVSILLGHGQIADFGKLLHEGWQIKRAFSKNVSTPLVDQVYEAARSAGALGGKLLGAGGGGFMLLFVRREDQPKVREALKNLLLVPFQFENQGAQLIFYEPGAHERDGRSAGSGEDRAKAVPVGESLLVHPEPRV